MTLRLYLIGSLRNPQVPVIAAAIRQLGFEVIDDWFAAGPEADDYWQKYEKGRGHSLPEALEGRAARNVVQFDKKNIDRSSIAVLLMPAGKSGHLELGYACGFGLKTFVLMDIEPERFDVMYALCTGLYMSLDELLKKLVTLL